MIRDGILLLMLMTWPVRLLAQQPSIDPPVANRPVDFSNIVGKYVIEASAEPTQVHVEDPITLRITIRGDGPEKDRPRRENLHLFPAWDDDFYVQEIPEEHRADLDGKTWRFVYRLRPKHAKIDVIDGIKLVFFNPDKPGKIKFETRRAEPIAIVVTPRPERSPEVPLAAAPESFERWSDSAAMLTREPPAFSGFDWRLALILIAPPLACMLAAGMRWRFFPDDHRRKRWRRSVAAKRALSHLQAGTEAPWVVVNRYLHERFDFAVDAPTPADVAAFLQRRGFARDVCGQGLAFFRTCDAIVYASGPTPARLRDDAIRLMNALEADPCARG